MKIVLSRKSFDSKYGGKPNLIFQDGSLLPLPIPGYKNVSMNNFKGDFYNPTEYGNIKIPAKIQKILKENQLDFINNYAELMLKLFEKSRGKEIQKLKDQLTESLLDDGNRKPYYCHLDPDLIYENLRRLNGWHGLFGPSPDYHKHLSNELKESDLILFFGTFRHVIIDEGSLRYANRRDGEDLIYQGKHLIYGYLQIKKIVVDLSNVENWMYQPYHHPHLDEKLWNKKNRALYVARKHLYLDGKKTKYKGYGVFEFSEDLVLTEKNESTRIWKKNLFPKGSIIKHKSNIISQSKWNRNDCFEWDSFGQEFIIERCPEFENHIINKVFRL